MAYNKKQIHHLCFLAIDPILATFEGVIFTDTNATKADHQRSGGLRGLSLVNFDAVHSHRPWDKEGWHRPVQAEVLVPNRIPLEYVKRIVFISHASKEYAKLLWDSPVPPPPFELDSRIFYDNPNASIRSANFAYLDQLILTDVEVTKSNVTKGFNHTVDFNRDFHNRITLLAKLAVLTGTQADIKWKPVAYDHVTRFNAKNVYWSWHSLALSDLPDGLCFVEYYIDDVLWSKIYFNIT
jgi:ssDNA thymidine ADP-ribosyltransferase, DarT